MNLTGLDFFLQYPKRRTVRCTDCEGARGFKWDRCFMCCGKGKYIVATNAEGHEEWEEYMTAAELEQKKKESL